MSFTVIIDKKTNIKLYNLNKNQYNKYLFNINQLLNTNIIYFIGKNFKNANFFSLFIEECDLTKLLDKDDITNSYDSFHILNLYEDDCGINHIGTVNYISNIFMKNQISILYINTFNENIILVSEKDLENAIMSLYSYIDNDKIKIVN